MFASNATKHIWGQQRQISVYFKSAFQEMNWLHVMYYHNIPVGWAPILISRSYPLLHSFANDGCSMSQSLGICKITPTSPCSRLAMPSYKHGLIKMKLQYMLISYFSNNQPSHYPPLQPSCVHSHCRTPGEILQPCKNSTMHSHLVRRLWFSIAGVSRARSPSLCLTHWQTWSRSHPLSRGALFHYYHPEVF